VPPGRPRLPAVVGARDGRPRIQRDLADLMTCHSDCSSANTFLALSALECKPADPSPPQGSLRGVGPCRGRRPPGRRPEEASLEGTRQGP